MPESLEQLCARVAAEARGLGLAPDREVYEAAGRDPLDPLLYAGRLDARVCILGRDPGRDEILRWQPLVGASGRAVREGVLAATGSAPRPEDPLREDALRHVLLCNVVPYKPVGNKAWPASVRERFRPHIERLLACHWRGNIVIALGNEAFRWFECRGDADAFRSAQASPERYTCDYDCVLDCDGTRRRVAVCPLPHPSPLNARWRKQFAGLLARRLRGRVP